MEDHEEANDSNIVQAPKYQRRHFLGAIATGATSFAIGRRLVDFFTSPIQSPGKVEPAAKPTPAIKTPEPNPTAKFTPTVNPVVDQTPKVRVDTTWLNRALAAPLKSEQKFRTEEEIMMHANSLDEIKLAFKGIFGQNNREALTARIDLLIEQGKLPSLLSQKHKEWCVKFQVDETVLNLCIQLRNDMLPVIQRLQLQKRLRPDLPDNIDPRLITFSAGGLAKLLTTESGKFSEIGDNTALSQINEQKLPGQVDALKKLCQLMSRDSGLNYDYKEVPGSPAVFESTNPTSTPKPEQLISGGALGIAQLMPGRALNLYYELLEATGEKLNVFDPFSTIKALILDSAFRWKVERKTGSQISSYERGNRERIEALAFRWNQDPVQINKIVSATLEYDLAFDS